MCPDVSETIMEKPKTDEELLERLRQKAPEILEADMDFNSTIMRVLKLQQQKEKKVSITVKLKPGKRSKRKAS
jgi:hypothetical protein